MEDRGGNNPAVHVFESPVVGGSGEDLPMILGLKFMRSKNAVLKMTPGRAMLTFLGPGGYEITWSPGTQHFPLRCAPSGHMVLPLGDFSKVEKKRGGLPPTRTIFHATGDGQSSSSNSL